MSCQPFSKRTGRRGDCGDLPLFLSFAFFGRLLRSHNDSVARKDGYSVSSYSAQAVKCAAESVVHCSLPL
jgi:hypothetical protein